MTMTVTQAIITVGIVITGTVFTRFIAYIAFPEGKKIPPFILYLGKVLGPAAFRSLQGSSSRAAHSGKAAA